MKSVVRFLPNYWWAIAVFWGVLHILYIKSYEQGCLKLMVLVTVFSFVKIRKFNETDVIFTIYLLYVFFSGWFKTEYYYFSYTISIQILPMLFYFIGRSDWFIDNKFINNLRMPILFAMICGILLYIVQPSWYMNWKMQNWTNIQYFSDTDYYERLRLSGFWSWSYYLGYMSLFYIILIVKKNIIEGIPNKFFFCELSISCLTLFLAQQRVSIAYALLFQCIITIYIIAWRNDLKSRVLYFWILLILVIVIIYFINSYVINDSALQEYILNRTINKEDNLIEERIMMFEGYIRTITFLGSGLGSMSHIMIEHTRRTINDCDYLRLLNEIGVVGFSLLAAIIVSSIIKGLKKYKEYFFEINILLFLLVSMIGANPLEVDQLHPVMYWYCMGRIQSGEYRKYKLYINRERKNPYSWIFLS